MATPKSIVNLNSREQVLSSDVVRLQKVSSRELQNIPRDDSRSDTIASGGGGTDTAGTPRNACQQLPTLAPIATTFTMTLGAFEAYYFTNTGVGADDSDYQVLAERASQVVTFANPDGANPRFDLVVAALGTESVDVQSRLVLLDPVLRTTANQNLVKTLNPNAVVTVVTGTAAANPSPPAVPANTVALFEVLVPAAVADSTSFQPVRRLWSRISGPVSTYNGVLSGCVPEWTQVDEAAASSALSTGTNGNNRVVIDGETIVWGFGTLSSAGSGVAKGVYQTAGADNPFNAAAPVNSDKPYYIYICGGRNFPMLVSSFPPVPAVLVESLTAPDERGHAFTDLTVTGLRGGTIPKAATLFVGVGFVTKNSTNRKPCRISGDWVYAMNGSTTLTPSGFLLAFNDSGERILSTVGSTNISLATRPDATATNRAKVVLYARRAATAGGEVGILVRLNVTGTPNLLTPLIKATSDRVTEHVDFALPTSAPEMLVGVITDAGDWDVWIMPLAYNIRVPRLSQ